MSLASPEDLVQHGMIPEMVGRLPVFVALKSLESGRACADYDRAQECALIRQYEHLLSLDNVELVFEDAAMRAAAELAIERDTGARGLRSIIESCLLNVMFEAPSHAEINKVVINENVIRGEEQPQVYTRDGGVTRPFETRSIPPLERSKAYYGVTGSSKRLGDRRKPDFENFGRRVA